MKIARVFWSEGAQAVRLPRGLCFDAEQVRVRRQGHALILEPIEDDWSWVDEVVGEPLDEDFAAAALNARKPSIRQR